MKSAEKKPQNQKDVATKIKALLKDYNQKEEHTLEEIIDFHYTFETITSVSRRQRQSRKTYYV